MAGATNTGESAFLNAVLGGGTSPAPLTNLGSCFISLHDTADPGETAVFTNVCTGTGYANVAVTFTTASADSVQNTATVTFTTNGNTDWGVIVGYGVHLSDTAGNCSAANMIISGEWDASATVNAGDTVQIAAGDLVITCG